MIELINVTKHYTLGGETIKAVEGFSQRFDEGSFTAIVGPSGSGKSSLLHLIGGLDTPDSGEVVVRELRLSDKNDKELSIYRNKTVGFIFQTFNLQPHYTAYENIELPLFFARVDKDKRKKLVNNALEKVNLVDRAKHRPSELSGGQRQRVAIARAIVNEPSILLADEPTGNLDSKSGKQIIELLIQLRDKNDITVVLVTHNQDDANKADRIIHLRDGVVQSIESGVMRKVKQTINSAIHR